MLSTLDGQGDVEIAVERCCLHLIQLSLLNPSCQELLAEVLKEAHFLALDASGSAGRKVWLA
eukprot:679253-Amphidinium_carterae.1